MSETFGDRLKAAREARGLTQAELAERAGMAAVHVSHLETGVKPNPAVPTLVRLATALRCSADYLLGLGDGAADERAFRAGWTTAMKRIQSFAASHASYRGEGLLTITRAAQPETTKEGA